MVTNNSFTSGSRFLISRAASIPFNIGMVMSRMMRSGLRRVAASTRAFPSSTVPTTAYLGLSRFEKPSSIRAWSSARRIRGRFIDTLIQGNRHGNAATLSRLGVNRKSAAHDVRSLADAHQAEPALAFHGLGSESNSVVIERQDKAVIAHGQ